MPYEPFDYYEETTHTIRELDLTQYQPTLFKPWRQVRPEPSSDLVFKEPISKILVKLRLAISPDQKSFDIIGSAIAFPPNFWEEKTGTTQLDRDLANFRRYEREAEKQHKKNESTSQDPRNTPDQK